MVCNRSYGNGSVEGYKRDIQDAQEMGIDGFALNLGAWNKNYQQNIQRIFQAANELNTGFKLFFSPDRCCGLNDFQIIDMFKKYATDSSYYYYRNKPFLSAYSGAKRPDWWLKAVIQPLEQSELKPYFVPYLHPKGHTPIPDEANLRGQYEETWQYILDGYFYFGAAGLPVATTQSGEFASALMHNNGKTYMAPVTPYYWGNKQTHSGRRFFDYKGGEGLEMQWKSIIEVQKPEWVEVVTWNDWDEGTYFSPMEDISKQWNFNAHKRPGFYKTHRGFSELNKYFIEWYKTDKQPESNDKLFFFYRTHPKDMKAPSDERGPVTNLIGQVEDQIFITCILSAPAELIVKSGKKTINHQVPAGISHKRIPFQTGPQKFELRRNGKLILIKEGEEISDSLSEYNFNYYSDFIHR